ncbi:methylthioribose kinase [Cnuibacter physcomitrellae]|uniref:phosphotransferase n=1 Tax=Cnuibacter physcomitrellae TaxID=1619308 RepID=UPI0019C521F0|nr:phosphotransferase [Cnuibacter physcomitrellae]GGI41068.1 methylthioribose kinase [Cnuibacter physcomitrellae]
MSADYPLLDDRDDVVEYLVRTGGLSRVADEPGQVEVVDVTAGNMNRVFLARGPLGSIALKQAPPFVQSIGPEWPIDPSRIAAEAATYALLAERVPDSIPEIVGFDDELHVLLMEDLSDLAVLRDALAAEHEPDGRALDHADVGAVVGGFVGALAAATTREALGEEAFAELSAQTGDEGLMQITRDFLLGYPLREHETNRWEPALDERVRALRASTAVADAVEGVRGRFETASEALIHGDLHTGSVMVGFRDGGQVVKVFDPEFAFVGPIGMDLGLFWAGVEVAVAAAFAAGDDALALRRWEAIPASLAAFTASAGLDPARVDAILDDAWRFAGIEMVRRIAGFSHASDLDGVLPEGPRAAASAAVLDAAAAHIVTGRGLASAESLRPVDPSSPLSVPSPAAPGGAVGDGAASA